MSYSFYNKTRKSSSSLKWEDNPMISEQKRKISMRKKEMMRNLNRIKGITPQTLSKDRPKTTSKERREISSRKRKMLSKLKKMKSRKTDIRML
jgi:hypothetical protein